MAQKMNKVWLITLVIILLWCSESPALFETEGLGARCLSLGGGCTAVSDQPSVMASNPAGLGFYQKRGVQLSWSQLFNLRELSAGDLYFAYHPGRIYSIDGLTLGLGLSLFGQSDYYQEAKILFSFGYRIKNRLSLGISVKYMRVSFPSPYSSLSAIGFDCGMLIRVQDKIQIGAAVKNLNKPEMITGSEDVPRIWDLGAALYPFEEVILVIDWVKDSQFEHQLKFGQEIKVLKRLALRFGVGTEPVTYGWGTGFEWQRMKIDYALLSHPTLGASHMFTFSLEW